MSQALEAERKLDLYTRRRLFKNHRLGGVTISTTLLHQLLQANIAADVISR